MVTARELPLRESLCPATALGQVGRLVGSALPAFGVTMHLLPGHRPHPPPGPIPPAQGKGEERGVAVP